MIKYVIFSFILFCVIVVYIIPTIFGILKELDDLVERNNETIEIPDHITNYKLENIDADELPLLKNKILYFKNFAQKRPHGT